MTLPDATRARLVETLKGWLRDELDVDAGDLQAGFLLDHVLTHVGPEVYALALRDAQDHLRTVVEDLDVAVAPRHR